MSGLWRVVAVALLLAAGSAGLLQARALDTGSALNAPHGIHVVWGRTDASAPATPLARRYAAPGVAGVVGPKKL